MKKFLDICQFSLVLAGLMICGLFLTSVLSVIPAEGLTLQWIIFSAQNILAFMLPAILAWKICFKQNPMSGIKADRSPSAKMIGLALAIYAVGIPALNQIVYWNQEIHLPQALAPFEEWCRNLERLAEEQTEGILSVTSIGSTLINILVVGVLTGIGEEFFFRGALQGMLVRCKVNHHVAIWTAAAVFSFLHFQFFGFVPRLLLGAFFGYLFWWSGSIWVNSLAHALNNSIVIVSAWCINKGYLSEEFDMAGVATDSFPVAALLSACAVAAIIYLYLKSDKHQSTTANNATESIR
ncbi:MAG: type II CAAX endopeptidase family protein [Bacteroidales bacterium]|nr:type II CAAX endopeptidase family protein [Bacteroidales bacterium]